MQYLPKKQSGYTLIEILVVLVIIAVSSSIVLVGLSNHRVSRELQKASHELAAVIQEAQNYALTGKAAVINEQVCWYAVRFQTNDTFELYKRLKSSSTDTACTGAWSSVSTHTLTGGVTLSGVPIPGGLAFKPPRAETLWFNGSWGGFATPQLITLTKSSINHYLCLYPIGRIEEMKTNSTCL